jgi:hypothetical protein
LSLCGSSVFPVLPAFGLFFFSLVTSANKGLDYGKNVNLKSINWGIIYSSGKILVGKETNIVGLNEIFLNHLCLFSCSSKPPISADN